MTGRAAAAGELAFATPAGWFTISLPDTPADAGRLARQVAAAHPGLVRQPDALAGMLSGLAEVLRAARAVGAYGALFDASGVAMPATLLVSVQPAGGYDLEQVGRELSGAGHPGAASATTMFDLPAGRTVRAERLTEPPATGDDRRPVSFIVNYVTEVPGRDQVVVLTFATPALALIDELRPVFHQIACTLLINPAGQVQPPASPGPPRLSDPAEAR